MADEHIGQDYEAQCMKCKQQRPFTADDTQQMKNGTTMVKGRCHVCQTKMVRILPKPKPEPEEDTFESFEDLLPRKGRNK